MFSHTIHSTWGKLCCKYERKFWRFRDLVQFVQFRKYI